MTWSVTGPSVLDDHIWNCTPNSKPDLLFMGRFQGVGACEVQGGPSGRGRGDFQDVRQNCQGDKPGRLCGLLGWSPGA